MRSISTAMRNALDATHVASALFVQCNFDSGTQFYWTGGASIAWNGNTWLGTGSLVSLEPIRETGAVEAVGLQVTMSGVPSALVSLALSEQVQGRTITIWLAAMDSVGQPVGSPIQVFAGRMDAMSIDESNDAATITLTVESEIASLMSAAVRRYTDADQQAQYAGDKFFAYVPQMVEKLLPFPSREAQQ